MVLCFSRHAFTALGDGSALAISHAALEKYLSQHGREWERYAWIKARVVTGVKKGKTY